MQFLMEADSGNYAKRVSFSVAQDPGTTASKLRAEPWGHAEPCMPPPQQEQNKGSVSV